MGPRLRGDERLESSAPLHLLQHPLKRHELIGLARGLVPAQAADPREAHGDAGLVAGGALQALEGHLEDQAVVRLGADRADRAEAFDGVVADELVDLLQLLVGEAEIGLADRGEDAGAGVVEGPDPEGVVGVEAGAFAVAAPRAPGSSGNATRS